MTVYDISSFERIMQNYFEDIFSWEQVELTVKYCAECYNRMYNPKMGEYKNDLGYFVEDALFYLKNMYWDRDTFTIEEIVAAMPFINKVASFKEIEAAAEDYLISTVDGNLYGL